MRFKAGSGDAGQFILLQAVARGGQLLTTNGFPAITGAGRYSEDPYGVVIRMPRDNYEDVEKLLRKAFGEPISNRQSVAFMVANIAIELQGMRLVTYKAAARAAQAAK